MTDAPHNDDERDELVSAYLDGEATEPERALVEADPALLAEVEALARLRAAVQATPAPSDDERDAALAAAMAAATEPGGVLAEHAVEDPSRGAHAAVPLAARRDRLRQRRARYLAVAAAVAVAALAVPLLADLGGDDDTESVALEAAREDAEDDASAGEAFDEPGVDSAMEAAPTSDDEGSNPAATTLAGDDLGAHRDLDALADAVAEQLHEADAVTPPAGSGEGVTSTTLGARSCGDQLAVPTGAEVLLEATATVDGEPVVVVVHRLAGGGPQLLVATASSCEVVIARPL